MENNGTTKNVSIISKNEDLQVFFLDGKVFDSQMIEFSKIFARRSWTSRDFWLLNIPPHDSIDKIKTKLDKIVTNLDIDDDFYLYTYNEASLAITIWEYYRKHKSLPTSLGKYGEWNVSNGLKVLIPGKWKRRGDLEVIDSKV